MFWLKNTYIFYALEKVFIGKVNFSQKFINIVSCYYKSVIKTWVWFTLMANILDNLRSNNNTFGNKSQKDCLSLYTQKLKWSSEHCKNCLYKFNYDT